MAGSPPPATATRSASSGTSRGSSLTYWDAEQDNVHVEAVATVAEDQADRSRIWDLFAGTEPPLGYDPGLFWASETDPAFAVLRLEPTRIELTGLRHRSSGRAPLIWRP